MNRVLEWSRSLSLCATSSSRKGSRIESYSTLESLLETKLDKAQARQNVSGSIPASFEDAVQPMQSSR
eukprot:4625951-Pleurochrysis_carterae.AAC.1